jgi:dATP pyrophosphohydrolase
MKTRYNMIAVFVIRPTSDGASHEFLQLRRAKGEQLGETWQIVRGGVKKKETYAHAALRELREETGIKKPLEFYRTGTVESFYIAADDTLWHGAGFCALVSQEQSIKLNHEHNAFRWVPRDQIDQQTMWASERMLLRDLIRDILDDGPAKPHLRLDLSRL